MKKLTDTVLIMVLIVVLITVLVVSVFVATKERNMSAEFDGTVKQGFEFGWLFGLPALQGLDQKTVVVWLEQDTYIEDALIFGCCGEDNLCWWLYVNHTFDASMYFGQYFDDTNGRWQTTNAVVTSGSKHMMAVSYDKTDVANNPVFFVDGTIDATVEVAAPVGTALDGLDAATSVGAGSGSVVGPIDGRLYVVAIYNRILPESELDDLYTARSIRAFREHEGLVFLTDLDSGDSVQNYDGHTFVGSEYIKDEINGYIGYQSLSPIGRADDYLHR